MTMKIDVKKIYRDVRARFDNKYSDADIIASLEVDNNLLTAKLKIAEMDLANRDAMIKQLKRKQNE